MPCDVRDPFFVLAGTMRINHSMGLSAGLNAFSLNQRSMNKTLTQLSTGLRIYSASDDAAGLAISENIRSQVRGASQARKNTLDGISMLNVAEGGLNSIHELLQRGRELSIQSASETLPDTERTYLNLEVRNIIEEVDRVSSVTTFNGRNILTGGVNSNDAEDITKGLKDSRLAQAEKLVTDNYGITADAGEAMDIKLESGGAGGTAAYVAWQYGPDGRAINMSLNVDVDDFIPVTDENGGTAPFYADRIIAHEMVHAVMASSMDTRNIPTWFMEGMAELIHGADERVQADLAANGNNPQALVDGITSGSWDGQSSDYSGAYLAARFLQEGLGGAADVKNFMQQLYVNDGNLNSTFTTDGTWANTAAFLADFSANGANYAGYGVTLGDADIGGIAGGNAESVVPNPIANTDNPLNNFTENWDATADPITLHIGSNATDADELNLAYGSVSASAIGIKDISVGTAAGARGAISTFDSAIGTASKVRGDIGAYTNRLEHTINNLITTESNQQAAESQIRDTDFAAMASTLTKQQILSQSSLSMIAQANTQRQQILSLLK